MRQGRVWVAAAVLMSIAGGRSACAQGAGGVGGSHIAALETDHCAARASVRGGLLRWLAPASAFAAPSDQAASSCAQLISCDEPTIEDGVVHLTFAITVHRSLAEVRRAMDPQVWDDCNRAYFPKAYVAKRAATRAVAAGPCAMDGIAVDASTGDVDEDLNPPPLGAESGPFPLFEQFEADNGFGGAMFKNLLCITPTITDQMYSFRYDLIKSIKSRVANEPLRDGGILVDRGYVRVSDDGTGETTVTAEKYIAFSDPDLNTFAQLVIDQMCQEVAGDMGGTGVCCALGNP